MLTVTAFADEISPEPEVQIKVCQANSVGGIELRSAWGKNVLDLDLDQMKQVKAQVADAGLFIACIGSPIGKAKINDPWQTHYDRFRIAVDRAVFFGAPMIRIFSYYPPRPGDPPSSFREEVIDRMRAKVHYLQDFPGITLVHENEKDIFGQMADQCLDLMETVNSPLLRTAFDFANFVQVGQDPVAAWNMLKPYVTHIHIKDAIQGTGKVVPAGQGDGHLPQILRDAWDGGYRGYLSLEPHLQVAGHSHGVTGLDLFKVATDALKDICQAQGLPLAV